MHGEENLIPPTIRNRAHTILHRVIQRNKYMDEEGLRRERVSKWLHCWP
jgi:hypothetical protein